MYKFSLLIGNKKMNCESHLYKSEETALRAARKLCKDLGLEVEE